VEPIVYLTVEDIIDAHDEAIGVFGGHDRIRSQDALLSAIGQVEQSIFGQDAYPTLADKAAAYAFFLAQDQPFIDGNKRTAAYALLLFLDHNGHALTVTHDEELADQIIGIATRALSQAEFFAWVRTRVHAINEAPPIIALAE
jgi:death-on-curing protein